MLLFFINSPEPSEVAFKADEPTSLTVRQFDPYARNDPAVMKSSYSLSLGLPNRSTRLFSESTDTISCAGPHSKSPHMPPMVVATAGTTFVRSCSCIRTPGDSWKAMLISSMLNYYSVTKSFV